MSHLDSIRVSLTEYDQAMGSYSDGVGDVESGLISIGSLADIDEDRADAALAFADDAADFLREILPHLDALRIAHSHDTNTVTAMETRAAVQSLITTITSHRGTPITEGTTHE